jgi:heparan-alpha-glucosaminide N-acetyltransferase
VTETTITSVTHSEGLQERRTAPAHFAEGKRAMRQGEAKARFLPLDAYRGLIMILLVSNGFGFTRLPNYGLYRIIAGQFHHRPWGGATFYDLIMPAFLFMVGVAMPYAFAQRAAQGATRRDTTRHVLLRCLRLVLISEILVSIDENRAHLEVHNALLVVAVTYLACYFLMRLAWWKQAAAAATLLTFHSAIYLGFAGQGGGAFSQITNAGARLDRFLMLAPLNLPWQCVTINLITEIPSVLFGVWTGDLLLSSKSRREQLKLLTIGMIAAFVLGLGFSPLVPINKWLWTSTYVLYTTGWTIVGLLIFIVLVEYAGIRRPMFPLVVVARNSLFVYCLGMLLGGWMDRSIRLFSGGYYFLGLYGPVAQSCSQLLVIWLIAYWMYRRGVFVKV